MALPAWKQNPELGKEACTNERDSWQCPNMRPVPGDLDMEYEHYECRRCGRKVTLDYEEMK